MAAGRSFKSLVGRRRRAGEEGEDEEGPVLVEDSQSEVSVLSDAEDDDDADASSLGGPSAVEGAADTSQQTEGGANGVKAAGKKPRKGKKKGSRKAGKDEQAPEVSSQPQAGGFKTLADTEAMMSGLQIGEHATTQEVIDFESMDRNGLSATATNVQDSAPTAHMNGHSQGGPAERQRREHDEYKKKRDADPAFIPNRGQFFMHDTRSYAGQGNLPVRGAWNARGRGRGGFNAGGPFPPAGQVTQPERAAELPWKHDLHDTINEEPISSHTAKADSPQDRDESARIFSKSTANHHSQQQPRALSFSSTTLVGKVQIRVFLPGMKAPITFSEVPWKQYTRLPDHRPPLRRDKPVRIFLPGLTQRYIFPSTERSFIFIPRQMRPNQQGFGRNAYQRSIGGYGYSSRRTSMYGGSMYAASVAASRRSSFASVTRESAFSPVGAYGGPMPPTRPVVRLPHGSHGHYSAASTPMGPLSGHQTPTGFQVHTFPLPQQPTFQGTPTTTVHQPRPQKAISVTGIESPAALQQAPHQEIQPFQNQLPAHMHEQTGFNQPPPPSMSPRQQYNYPPQQLQQAGTPLSGIPEQAMHAPSFQPQVMPYGAPYYGMYQAQRNYYYPPTGPSGYPPMPMYAAPPQNYMMSPPAPSMPPAQTTPHQQPPSRPTDDGQQQAQPQSQSGMVAHESNGMVFYIPASEAQQQSQGESYQPAESFVPSYAMPGLPPPTPAPETAYYYPPQMQVPAYYPGQAQPQ